MAFMINNSSSEEHQIWNLGTRFVWTLRIINLSRKIMIILLMCNFEVAFVDL
jgi:hypothetical protein